MKRVLILVLAMVAVLTAPMSAAARPGDTESKAFIHNYREVMIVVTRLETKSPREAEAFVRTSTIYDIEDSFDAEVVASESHDRSLLRDIGASAGESYMLKDYDGIRFMVMISVDEYVYMFTQMGDDMDTDDGYEVGELMYWAQYIGARFDLDAPTGYVEVDLDEDDDYPGEPGSI